MIQLDQSCKCYEFGGTRGKVERRVSRGTTLVTRGEMCYCGDNEGPGLQSGLQDREFESDSLI